MEWLLVMIMLPGIIIQGAITFIGPLLLIHEEMMEDYKNDETS